MGGHYGSIHIRTDDSEAVWSAVAEIARERKLKFFIAPVITGWIAVFPENNGQDSTISEQLASRLPEKELIQCLVHDDDIFAYWFFENGSLKDRYNSCPTYFSDKNPEPRGGNAQSLAHLLVKGGTVPKLQGLLDRERFDFEMERFDKFAALLGLPNAVTAYEYLQGGERDGIKHWGKFVHVPDLTAEKDAKRAAAAKVRSEMKRLLREGILLVDQVGEKTAHRDSFKSPAWCINPAADDVLIAWSCTWYIGPSPKAPLARLGPGSWQPRPTYIELSGGVRRLEFSNSGRWLAVEGEERQIWDMSSGSVRPLMPEPRSIRSVCFSPDDQFYFSDSESGVKVVSVKDFQAVKPIPLEVVTQEMAVHPEGRVLAIVDNYGVLILINLETFQVITQAWIKERFGILPEGIRAAMVERAKQSFLTELAPHLSASALKSHRAGSERHFLPKDPIRTVTFSPDGKWLFCGTREGLHALEWNEVVACPDMSPVTSCFFVRADIVEKELPGGTVHKSSLVYAVVFDSVRQRVLFSGLEGKVRYLELASGNFGDLLVPPDPAPIFECELLPNRSALVCTARKIERNQNPPSHFQVWNYPKLCEAAGIPF
jgi:WD40 repeat protein